MSPAKPLRRDVSGRVQDGPAGTGGPGVGHIGHRFLYRRTFAVLALSMIGPSWRALPLLSGLQSIPLWSFWVADGGVLIGAVDPERTFDSKCRTFFGNYGPRPGLRRTPILLWDQSIARRRSFCNGGDGPFRHRGSADHLESSQDRDIFKTRIKNLLPNRQDWRRCWAAVLRGSILVFLSDASRGAGLPSPLSSPYAVEKRVSRHPEAFGTGVIEGVASPESANNAAATAALTPLLTLGVPGTAGTAMLFVALMIHGIRPGPLLFQEHPHVFWGSLPRCTSATFSS